MLLIKFMKANIRFSSSKNVLVSFYSMLFLLMYHCNLFVFLLFEIARTIPKKQCEKRDSASSGQSQEITSNPSLFQLGPCRINSKVNGNNKGPPGVKICSRSNRD